MKIGKRNIRHFLFDAPREDGPEGLVIHPPRWLSFFLALWLMVSIWGFFHSSGRGIFLCLLLVLIGVLAVTELSLASIRLLKNSLEVKAGLRKRRFDRSDILRVGWKKGCPLFLELRGSPPYLFPSGFHHAGVAMLLDNWLSASGRDYR